MEAVRRINDGDIPRNLNAPQRPSGALGLKTEIAESIDENISTNPEQSGKSDSSSEKMKKPNNDEIIGDANESMEITYVRLDKLLNEEIGKPDEKTNNEKNNDKDSDILRHSYDISL